MVVIVTFGEIAIKGQNRIDFERKLVRNIRDCLKKNNIEFKDIKRQRGRLFIDTDDPCDCLKYVFGIAYFFTAKEVSLDLDSIKEEALRQYSEGSFRVSTKRTDKVLMGSVEIEREIGAYIVEHTGAKVNLKGFDVEIKIDIFKDKAFVSSKKTPGLKGLPVGIEGQVAVLLENQDSIKAALLMMKRGCSVMLIKVKDIDYTELEKYAYGFKIRVQDEIPEYIDAIVTSETLETLQDRDSDKIILRPLIAQ